MLVFEPVATISLIGSFFILAFIYYGYRNRGSSIFKYFLIFALFTFGYVFSGSLEAITTFMPLKVVLFYIGSASYPFVYAFWLIFVFRYLNMYKVFKNKVYLLIILIFPILGLFGVITNEWLHLFYSTSPMYYGLGAQCYYETGILDTLCVIYGYLVGLIGIYVLISSRKSFSKDNRNQLYYLILSQLFLFAGGILLQFDVYPGFDILCFATTFAMITLFITFAHYGVFTTVPIAHQMFIDTLDMGMLYFNEDDLLTDFNPAASKFLNLTNDSKFKSINEIFYVQGIIDYYFSDEYSYEYQHPNKHWYEFSKTVVGHKNEVHGKILIINDITTIKDAENEALESLKIVEQQRDEILQRQKELNESNIEKNFLLNEVHHRVRNNLQLVSSILTLDKRMGLKTSDEIVESTMARVSAMSIVYQTAYDVDRLSALDFAEFIETNMDQFLKISHGTDINVDLDLERDIHVASDVLSPLTLILNEIFTNAVSYAYNENQEDKKLFITLKRSGDNSAYLIIEDNGIGLPEDLDVANSNSIGFIIMNLLANQLGGKLSRLESEGTSLKIDFLIEK